MANTSVRIDTVGLGIAWSLGETYRIAIDEGFVNQEGNSKMPIASNTSIISFSTPANPPQIANTIPTHTSTAPINITDISFTIDRSAGNITILGGNVFLNRQGSPNIVVKTFAVSNASVSGNTVAFSVIGNLEASQTYFITSNANIFLDRDGFKNNAISNSSSFRFVSPVAPITTTFSPSAPANPNFTEIYAGFDRTIFSNSGNLFLHNANTNAVIRTYNISSALISNNSIILNIVGNIDANGYYYVKSNANVVMDVTQIKYPGFTNTTLWAFKAPTSPFLVSTVPTNATTSASRSLTTSASFTLDRTVTAVSGNVYLYKQASPNVLLKTWTIGSNVSFNSDKTFTVTIPQGMLAPTQAHYISTDANIAKDLTYINFPGISTTGNVFTFTTDVAPLLSTTFPTYGTALDENESNISFTMDRVVTKNVGNVYLYKIDTVNGNSLVKTYDITANTYLIGNDTVRLPVTNTLKVMESYYVNSDFDILKDYYTNEKYQGIIDANTFVFTTSVNRTYVADRPALLFPDNIPQITETDLGNTYTVTLQLSSSIGQIHLINDSFVTPTGWNSGTNTYTVTGNKTAVNSNLSNLYFLPFAGLTSSASITFTQSKNSVFQKSQTFTINGSASPAYLAGGGNTYSIPEDSKFNFMPFYIYPSWNSNCAVMIKSIQSSNVAIDPGKFYANTASGWTNANDGVIYKTFSRPANLVVYNSQVAEVRDIYYWLSSDYTTSFTIDALLGIESTPSGNTLTGGTLYSVTNTYNITPETEYSLLTSSTYIEDTIKAITLSIDDDDVHPNITYNVQMQQLSPDPGLIAGAFTSPGVVTKSYGSISDTQAKSTWNNVYYYPPADYDSSIVIGATITKIQTGKANITLASNVAITLTNSSMENEYSITNLNYVKNLYAAFNPIITDTNNLDDLYYINIRQISPDPITYPANILLNGVDLSSNAISSLTKAQFNSNSAFYPPINYIGNVIFGYTQIRQTYNGNITQASNIAITANCSVPNPTVVRQTDGYTFAEDDVVAINWNLPEDRFSYYINFKQISPDPTTQPANINFVGLGWRTGGNITISSTGAVFNNYGKFLTPFADSISNILIGVTQIKSTYAGNIVDFSNLALTITSVNNSPDISPEYTISNGVALSNTQPTSLTVRPTLLGYTHNTDTNSNSTQLFVSADNWNGNVYDVSNNHFVSIYRTSGYRNSTPPYLQPQPSNSIFLPPSSSAYYWNGSPLLGYQERDSAGNMLNPTAANLYMSGDFTWELNFLVSSYVSNPLVDSLSASRGINIKLNSNGSITWLVAGNSASVTQTVSSAYSLNTWTHLALVRASNAFKFFIDGIQQGSDITAATPGFTPYASGYFIGRDYNTSEPGFVGYLDKIRFTNGLARYTSNFISETTYGNNFGNLAIVDQAQNKQYSSTLTSDNGLVNIIYSNISYGNSITFTGTKSNINSQLSNVYVTSNANVSFGGTIGNVLYSQTQTSDSIIQASNVAIRIKNYKI